jgi:hypothetical protein
MGGCGTRWGCLAGAPAARPLSRQLSLYLDFLNLFLLQLFGDRRR